VASGHDIPASVFIECGAMSRRDSPAERRPVGETEFAAGAAAMAASGTYGNALIAAGIVAHANLRLGDRVGAVLDAHKRAAGGRLRGVRQIAAWHENPAARGSIANPPPHLLMDGAFREGVEALARAGLSFDTFLYHTQNNELADLARAFLDLPVVANHIAGAIGIGPYADRRGEVFADWRAALSRLAACDNAHIKLGGLGMRVFGHGFGERDAPPASQQLERRGARISAPRLTYSDRTAACSKARRWSSSSRSDPSGSAEVRRDRRG
jgi:predicted TIM-barrel fold metal-dependent hydrolase